jgi:uncharacterized protein (DUF924 family)
MTFDPEAILSFWFDDAAQDPERAAAREGFWFGSSPEADALVRERFAAAIDAASAGELDHWGESARSALARVILLDQFPRNVWRGTARAFAHDPLALVAARSAVAAGRLAALSPVERAFLILPYQHSESLDAQRDSVRLSDEIARSAPAAWRPLLEHYADFARQHLALIERFGRFPHRNAVLGRTPTAGERAYLERGGASFGQTAR